MERWQKFVAAGLVFCLVANLNAEEISLTGPEVRERLRSSAWFFGYPGSMLFHTAFHGGMTTRFVLLKTALHSEEFAKHLSLDDQQRMRITQLKPVKIDLKEQAKAADPNAQPDEQIVQLDYYAFLQREQLKKLDMLALRFDGYIALTRQSVATDLELTAATKEKIAKAAVEIREKVFLPRFRLNYAGTPPTDIKYRDCHFAGSLCTQLNVQILDILTDEECRRFGEWLSSIDDNNAFDAVERLAKLPDGLGALYRFVEEKP